MLIRIIKYAVYKFMFRKGHYYLSFVSALGSSKEYFEDGSCRDLNLNKTEFYKECFGGETPDKITFSPHGHAQIYALLKYGVDTGIRVNRYSVIDDSKGDAYLIKVVDTKWGKEYFPEVYIYNENIIDYVSCALSKKEFWKHSEAYKV